MNLYPGLGKNLDEIAYFDSICHLNGPIDLPVGEHKNLKIIENGREVSYIVGKIHQTTKIIDLDPA